MRLPGHHSTARFCRLFLIFVIAAGVGSAQAEESKGTPAAPPAPYHSPFQVAFSPDGARLASGSSDGAAIIWDIEPAAQAPAIASVEELAAYACGRAARNMTPAEWAQYIGAETPYRKTCPEWP